MYAQKIMLRLTPLILVFSSVECIWACSCGPRTPSDIFERAELIFYASVSDIEQNPSACGPEKDGERICRRDFIVSYDSLTPLSGEIPKHRYLFTRPGAACGASIETGREYLFFASVWNGEIRLSGCGATIEKDSTEEKQFWKHLKSEMSEDTLEFLNAES